MLGLSALGQALGLGEVGARALDLEVGQSLAWAITLDTGAVRTRDTGDALVVGLPNSLVTRGLVRFSLGAGRVVDVALTGILAGIPGATGSTGRQ